MNGSSAWCAKCGNTIQQEGEKALDGTYAVVWSDMESGWLCSMDGDEHEPTSTRPDRPTLTDEQRDALTDVLDQVERAIGLDDDGDLTHEGIRETADRMLHALHTLGYLDTREPCGQSYMAGSLCTRPAGHEGWHETD